MPYSDIKLTTEQIALIRHWYRSIQQGRPIHLPESLSNRAALVRRIEQIRRGNPALFSR